MCMQGIPFPHPCIVTSIFMSSLSLPEFGEFLYALPSNFCMASCRKCCKQLQSESISWFVAMAHTLGSSYSTCSLLSQPLQNLRVLFQNFAAFLLVSVLHYMKKSWMPWWETKESYCHMPLAVHICLKLQEASLHLILQLSRTSFLAPLFLHSCLVQQPQAYQSQILSLSDKIWDWLVCKRHSGIWKKHSCGENVVMTQGPLNYDR